LNARQRIPAHGWTPRPHQYNAWEYLQRGGKHAELIWHRRAGKDEVTLQHTAVSALQRQGNYWHMLPLASQVRKAIWTAVNPHTGRKRIDEVFPHSIRKNTRETEMQIELVNGSTWQALGSDNYQGAIGSSPVGIVYSEWAQSDPASRGYLRPILAENNGWQLYITTPRGANHAKRTFDSASRDPNAFAEILTAEQTGVFSPETLAAERQAYIDDHGEDFGIALFEQEYFCSFSAAVIGSYYGAQISKMERDGRIGVVPHDPLLPVYTAWDLGYTDDTAIWWYQVKGGKLRIIDYYFASGVGVAHYAAQIIGREVELTISQHRVAAELGADIPEIAHRKAYRYAKHYLPHDARNKTLGAAGKSIQDQIAAVLTIQATEIVEKESVELGIQAVRAMLPHADIDRERCVDGIEAVRQYQREWDDERKVFANRPLHNWCSHPADALRTLAMAWQAEKAVEPPKRDVIVPFTGKWLEFQEKEKPKVRYR
jgi:phage terminase large subunit